MGRETTTRPPAHRELSGMELEQVAAGKGGKGGKGGGGEEEQSAGGIGQQSTGTLVSASFDPSTHAMVSMAR